jgi:hypothetical protein
MTEQAKQLIQRKNHEEQTMSVLRGCDNCPLSATNLAKKETQFKAMSSVD